MRRRTISSSVSTNSFVLFTTQSCRVATYGITTPTPDEVLQLYTNPKAKCNTYLEFTQTIVPKLEVIETHVLRWRHQKWANRVPVLISQNEKDAIMTQLDLLKEKLLAHAARRDSVSDDVKIVSQILGISSRNELAALTREAIHKQISKLRYNGEVEKARRVKAAWENIEKSGSTDSYFLDRLCCVYGLLRNNCFETAFTNIIRKDPITKKIVLDKKDALRDAAECLITNMPSVNMYYGFLGFDPNGYEQSLLSYMSQNLTAKYSGTQKQQQQQQNNNGGVLFQEPNKEIVYYSVEKSGNANSTASSSRIVHIAAQPATQTAVVTLCIIASTNKYMREVQLPQRRELDGIARRAGFVLGLSPHSVRARTLFLPPRHVDGESLERLHQMMGGVFVEEFKQFAGQYTKELGNSAEEEDYKYQRKNLPQEEWLAL